MQNHDGCFSLEDGGDMLLRNVGVTALKAVVITVTAM
jgi:hypothetical protein